MHLQSTPSTFRNDPLPSRACDQCGTEYYPNTIRSRFCSRPCQAKNRALRNVEKRRENNRRYIQRGPTLQCEQCGAPFVISPARARQGGARYCSTECTGLAMRIYPPKVCAVCGDEFRVASGKLPRTATCPKRECRRAYRLGERNHNWRGGVTNPRKLDMASKEYREWRESVLSRDGWVCVECGSANGPMHAHHIEPWLTRLELRYDVANGQTLCGPCHGKTWKETARKNREYSC